MKKLNKAQLEEKERLKDKLREAHAELANTLERYNEQMTHLFNEVENANDRYNEAIREINEFSQGVAEEIGAYIEEKSDKWREGETGSAYSDWHQEWANVDLRESEYDSPEELYPPDDVPDLEELPDQP